MAARRLHWGNALAAVKADRAERSDVRSEPLKSFTRGVSLIAWRGRSGRRYICRILPADVVDASDLRDMVVIGVTADGTLVNAIAHCTVDAVMAMIDDGATHVHLHSLAETAAERGAVARDLRPLAVEAA